MTLRVTIPLAPSLNNAYPTNSKTGGRRRSNALIAFKRQSIPIIRVAANHLPFTPPATGYYRLVLRHYFADARSFRASDASNRIKAAEDALSEALGINDNRIHQVTSIKAGIDRFEPRTEIEFDTLM